MRDQIDEIDRCHDAVGRAAGDRRDEQMRDPGSGERFERLARDGLGLDVVRRFGYSVASLDELDPAPAVEALVDRGRAQSGLDIELKIRLAYEGGRTQCRHVPEIEGTVYRLVQEALSNIVKYAGAQRALITIVDPQDDAGALNIEVRDDGGGFDEDAATAGFGLIGMCERLALVHGELEISSRVGGGTMLRAQIPVQRRTGDEPAALIAES